MSTKLKKGYSYLIKRPGLLLRPITGLQLRPIKITVLDVTKTCYKLMEEGSPAYYYEFQMFDNTYTVIEELPDMPDDEFKDMYLELLLSHDLLGRNS